MNKLKQIVSTKLVIIYNMIIITAILFIINIKQLPLDVEYIQTKYFIPISNFLNDKNEFLSYCITVIGFVILFIIGKLIIKKMVININEKKTNRFINIFFTIFIAIITGISIYNDGFSMLLFNKSYYFIIPTFIILYLLCHYNKSIEKHKLDKVYSLLILILFLGIFYFYCNNSYFYSQSVIHHFSAHTYPITKVLNGLTIGVDFNSIYGYYPYIYSLIMKIFGITTTHNMGIIFSVMMLLSFMGIYYICKTFIKRKVICFFVIASIYYILIIASEISSGGPYLQFSPHRIFFPIIMIVLITYYLKKGLTIKKEILGYFICSFSLFFNFETGIVVLLTYCIFLLYYDLGINKDKKILKRILTLIAGIILSLTIYLIAVELITYFRTNQLLNIKDLIFGCNVFASDGFFMLKMKLWDSWIIFAFLSLTLVAFSISKLYFFDNDKINNKDVIKLTLIILNIGLFIYYLGRSVNSNFICTIFPSIIILGIYLDELLDNKNKLSLVIIMFFAIIISSSVYGFILRPGYLYFESVKEKNLKYINIDINILNNIYKVTDQLEFFFYNDAYYYEIYHLKNDMKMSAYCDTFTFEQIETYINYLSSNKEKIYITNEVIQNALKNRYSDQLNEIILNNNYSVYDINGYVLFVPEKYSEQILTVTKELEKT